MAELQIKTDNPALSTCQHSGVLILLTPKLKAIGTSVIQKTVGNTNYYGHSVHYWQSPIRSDMGNKVLAHIVAKHLLPLTEELLPKSPCGFQLFNN